MPAGLVDSRMDKGYSGESDGKNNPDQEKVENLGPIPAGR